MSVLVLLHHSHGLEGLGSQGVVCCSPGFTPGSSMCYLAFNYMAAAPVARTALSSWLGSPCYLHQVQPLGLQPAFV